MSEIYNMFSINKKKILVTGAANGNGKAIAQALGAAGSELCLIDVDYRNLMIIADEIEKETGTPVKRFSVDLTHIIVNSFPRVNMNESYMQHISLLCRSLKRLMITLNYEVNQALN